MIGQTVGKYRILDRIGRGGMGTVYRAIDTTLDREVAIKVLNPELNDPDVARRFRSEAITVARANHPGIATVYELFQDGEQWLMVMEFVRGETLEALVTRVGPVPISQAFQICIQALTALGYAHRLGITHRDIKPANLMVTEDGVVKIMDFGIARVVGTEHLTQSGFLMGTPAYMAPEQVLGKAVDSRCDLYAMGVVLYRLTTARLPFKGDTAFLMAQSQVNDAPTPLRVVKEGLPAWLDPIVDRALAKNPDSRFQTAEEFRASLERYMAAAPESAGSPVTPEFAQTLPPGSVPVPVFDTTPPGPPSRQIIAPAAPATQSGTAAGAVAPVQPPAKPPDTVVLRKQTLAWGAAVAVGVVLVLAAVAAFFLFRTGPQSPPQASDAVAPPTPAPEASPMPPVASNMPPATPSVALPSTAPPSTGPPSTGSPSTGTSSPGSPPPAAPSSAPPTAPPPTVPRASAPAVKPLPSNATAAEAARNAANRTAPAPVTPVPAPVTPVPAVPSRSPVDDALLAFNNVKMLTVTGTRGREQDVLLNFGGGRISALAEKTGTVIKAVPYERIVHATYSRSDEPRWQPGPAVPPDKLDAPGSFLSRGRHWLTLQTADDYLILRLDNSNWSRILQVVDARAPVSVTRLQSQ